MSGDRCDRQAEWPQTANGIAAARQPSTSDWNRADGVQLKPGYDHPAMGGDSFVSSFAARQLGGDESDFVIVEWSDGGDSERDWIAPLHVHHNDDEAWYVLEGGLRFRIADDIFEVGPGRGVLAPKGTPHAYGNAHRGRIARYLLVMTPKILALIRALHEPQATDQAAIFRAHDSELLGCNEGRLL